MKTPSLIAFMGAVGLLLSAQASRALAYAFQGNDLFMQKTISFPQGSKKAAVIIFLSARCPCSRGHEDSLKGLFHQFSKDFEFIGIHSNQNESQEEAILHFKATKFPFPIIEDQGALIADSLRALKTPHVFVVRGDESLYEGGVDDTASGANTEKHFLRDALLAIRDGKPVSTRRARVLGCAIKRAR